jgi:hypothetical protein
MYVFQDKQTDRKFGKNFSLVEMFSCLKAAKAKKMSSHAIAKPIILTRSKKGSQLQLPTSTTWLETMRIILK